MSSKGYCSLLALALALVLTAFNSAHAITLAQLQANIDAQINGANSSVTWSVKIENDAGNGSFYSRNATTMRRPASNTKIFTTAAAFRKFGPSYVWNGYALGSSSGSSPVDAILSDSNNTTADSLFAHVGGESACLAQIANITSTSGMNMDDGSGLDYDNRFNCEQTIDVVRWAKNTYTYSEWASHLAISCTSGTLASRICGTGKTGRVHAKTGTLTNGGTLALSGYVDNVNDGKRYYFSIYCNNIPSASQTDTRNRIDNIVGQMCQSGLPSVDPPVAEVIVDNGTANFAASSNWIAASSTAGYYGSNYQYRSTAAVSDQAAWSATLPSDGTYQVYARWTAGTNRAASATYTVVHAGGSTNVVVNQQANNGTWVSLGSYSFTAAQAQRARLSCWTTAGFVVVADAVRFVKQ